MKLHDLVLRNSYLVSCPNSSASYSNFGLDPNDENDAQMQEPGAVISANEKSEESSFIDRNLTSLSQWVWIACLALTICGVSVTYWLSSDETMLEVRLIPIDTNLKVTRHSPKM